MSNFKSTISVTVAFHIIGLIVLENPGMKVYDLLINQFPE
jgi:hypothetical protein